MSRIGVVVLDFGRPRDAARAAASARADGEDVRVLVVENGAPADAPSDADHLRLAGNRGFGAGMNAGLRQLLGEGCERILLLNSDAVAEPGCLLRLAGALEDPRLAAAGPVIVREADGRVESRGIDVDLSSGRVRLLGQGEAPAGGGVVAVPALSGAAMMVSRAALESVGPLDEEGFFTFEDVDWCLRARAAGFGLAVVLDARVRHGGSRTIGPASPDRFYYAARNHARLLRTHAASARGLGRLPLVAAAVLNLAHALRQAECPRPAAVRAVLEGIRDARRGRFGPRNAGGGERQ